MGWFIKILRQLFQRKESIMLQISLPENASAEQVKKAIATIGFFVGEQTMVAVLNGLGRDAGHAAPAAVIAAPPPPPPPPPVPGNDTVAVAPPPPPPPTVAPAILPVPELATKGLPWDERI